MSKTLPSNDVLTEEGLLPTGKSRLLILACGALAHEILAFETRAASLLRF